MIGASEKMMAELITTTMTVRILTPDATLFGGEAGTWACQVPTAA